MGNCCSNSKNGDPDTPERLAAETHFSENDVMALMSLFRNVSNSVVRDGLIHKNEFQLALFGAERGDDLFANRIFTCFDQKGNGVIEFGEFVRALDVFHPDAPRSKKTAFAFKIYDLGNTGVIERSEVRAMLVALLKQNKDLSLSDEALETVLDRTFEEADLAGDGVIHFKEWETLVEKNPAVISNMTLPILRQLTTSFPSFIFAPDAVTSSAGSPAKAQKTKVAP